MEHRDPPTIRNPYWNPFVFQAVFSTVPMVLVIGSLPFLSRIAGMSEAAIGTAFFSSRLGAILGGQVGPWASRWTAPHRAAAAAELANAAFGAGFYWGVSTHNASLALACLFLKAFSNGLLQNVRISWLKALPGEDVGRRIMVIIRVVAQSSYALIGLLILAGIAQRFTLQIVLVDIATSLLAAPVFARMKGLGIGPAPKSSAVGDMKILVSDGNFLLIATELSLAVGLGGTNILLVQTGDELFKPFGGYGFALVAYAGTYLVGGFTLQSSHPSLGTVRKFLETYSPAAMLASLAVLCVGIAPAVAHAAAFFALFLAYPAFLLTVDSTWFKLCGTDNIGRAFATRALLVNLILAVGEPAYSHGDFSATMPFRAASVAAASLFFYLSVRRAASTDAGQTPAAARAEPG